MVRNSEILTLVYLTTNFIQTLCKDKNNVYNQVPWPSFAEGGPLSDHPTRQRSDYRWDPANFIFDCVVALTYQNEHVATGVLAGKRYLFTSASAWEQFPWAKRKITTPGGIEARVVNDVWDKSKPRPIRAVTGNQVDRLGSVWIGFGTDKKHSPVHDFLIMETHYTDFWPLWLIYHERYANRNYNRTAYFSQRIEPGDETFPNRWRIVGFGFVDEADVSNSKQLQVFEYDNDVLEDCDEWLPRPWGYFICINNVDKLIGIASGAGLFHDDRLMGLGAFEVTKAKESILVFTNLAKYDDLMFHVRAY